MSRFNALLLILFAFVVSNHASALDSYPVTQPDKKFLAEIVDAVQRDDTAWIANHMLYPLSVVVSNETRIVNTKEEFKTVLGRELSKEIRTKITDAAKEPLFKNWEGVMVGNGVVWFTEFGDESRNDSWYGIDAIGYFAFQPSEPGLSTSSGH